MLLHSISARKACVSAPPSISCSSDRSIAGTATPSAAVYLRYPNGALVGLSDRSRPLLANPVTADNTGLFLFTGQGGNSVCTNGQANVLQGTYLVSYVPTSGCEGAPSMVCINATPTATPVLTTALPITPATTTLAGTAPANATVALAIDGIVSSSVTASSTGTFSFSGATMPALTLGRVLTLNASLNSTTCVSTNLTLNVVEVRTVVPPVVNGPLAAGATTVAGTTVEASGSTITLTTYANTTGSGTATGTYTTPVLTGGIWSATVPALAAASSVKATVTPVDYTTSGFSNVVAVQSRTTSIPIITGSYAEKGTTVTGTSAALVGSIITVYIDGGDPIGTATVQSGGGWSLTGLSDGSGTGTNTLYPSLYAGGILTATATETGKLPSQPSAPVTVGCANLAGKTYSAPAVCVGNAATFTVQAPEAGVVYSLEDATTGSDLPTGVSRVGTSAGSLTLTTNVYNTAGTYQIKLNAYSIGASNCSVTSTAVPLRINALPLDRTTAATTNPLPTGTTSTTSTTITVAASEAGTSYQLVNSTATPATVVGVAQTGTGSMLSFDTGPVTGPTTFTVQAVSVPGCARQVGEITVTRAPLPVELVAFEAKAQATGTLLTWRTAQEKNCDHFEVERSRDGRGFEKVATVAGHGTCTSAHNYSTVDAIGAHVAQLLYYRLRQVDQDGTSTFSNVRTVQFATTPAIYLYPNPTTGTAKLDLTALPAGSYSVRIVGTLGKTVRSQLLTGGQVHELFLTDLPAGMYMVQVQGSQLLTQRLLKTE